MNRQTGTKLVIGVGGPLMWVWVALELTVSRYFAVGLLVTMAVFMGVLAFSHDPREEGK